MNVRRTASAAGVVWGCCLTSLYADNPEIKTSFDHLVIAAEDAALSSATPDVTLTHGTYNYANYPEGGTNAAYGVRRIWLKFHLPEFSGSVVRAFFLSRGSLSSGAYYVGLYRASDFMADGVTPWRDETYTPADNITWNRQGEIGDLLGIHNQSSLPQPPIYGAVNFWNVRSGELAKRIGDSAGKDLSLAIKVFHQDHMDGSANAVNGGINIYHTEYCAAQPDREALAPKLVFDLACPKTGFDFVTYPDDDALVTAADPDTTENIASVGRVYVNLHEWQTNAVGSRLTRRQWIKFRLPHKHGTVKQAVFTFRRHESDGQIGNGSGASTGYITVSKASNQLADGVTPWHDEDFGFNALTDMNITWNRQGWIGQTLFNSSNNWTIASQIYTNTTKPYIEFSSPELDAYLNQAGPGGCVSFVLQNWKMGFDDNRAQWTADSGGNWIFTQTETALVDGNYYLLPTLHYRRAESPLIVIIK